MKKEKFARSERSEKKRSERSLEKNGLSKIKSNILPRTLREIKWFRSLLLRHDPAASAV
ncbi:MAG: hypothetical protein J0653_01030 [Deltaproteobacteria bacterium]|nr:hypothetical protein [Deltaproteobacteria bacterium]